VDFVAESEIWLI